MSFHFLSNFENFELTHRIFYFWKEVKISAVKSRFASISDYIEKRARIQKYGLSSYQNASRWQKNELSIFLLKFDNSWSISIRVKMLFKYQFSTEIPTTNEFFKNWFQCSRCSNQKLLTLMLSNIFHYGNIDLRPETWCPPQLCIFAKKNGRFNKQFKFENKKKFSNERFTFIHFLKPVPLNYIIFIVIFSASLRVRSSTCKK